MAAKVELQRLNERGWHRGFANLLARENSEWMNLRWLIRSLLWAAILGGVTGAAMWSPPSPADSLSPDDPLTTGVLTFVVLGGLIGSVVTIITMQGAIIDEKKSGTAAWILSKPVARSAFILSKLISHAVESLVRLVLIPGIVVFILLALRMGYFPAPIPYAIGVMLLSLHLLFYMTLTLMLGTQFDERRTVLGLPLLVLFAAQFVPALVPPMSQVMPWIIAMPTEHESALAAQAMLGQPLSMILPVAAAIIWSVIFVGLAIRRFEREEF